MLHAGSRRAACARTDFRALCQRCLLGRETLVATEVAGSGHTPLVAAKAAQDATMQCVLWATFMRRQEAGAMQVASLMLADGTSAMDRLYPS